MPEIISKSSDTPSSLPTQKSFSKKTVLIALAILLAIFVLVFALLYSQNSTDETDLAKQNSDKQNTVTYDENEKKEILEKFKTSNTVVYGSWKGEQSVISFVDLLSNQSTELASLPINIKKVSVLSPQQLLYIDQTDARDHGKQINVYQVKDKKVVSSIKASPGFGIDDYVLSPNKEYVAIWEVAFAPTSEALRDGRSRVFAARLSQPSVKHLLYDEAASGPIHYPRGVTNSGKVFTDRFLPNDPNGGAGWAYGMSVINFDGTGKQELSQMQEGTYGTQPSLSPDGRFLVFGGYDGSRGDGKGISEGFRQALLTPTTIELLDTQTLTRTRLTNIPNSDIYPTVEWGATSNNVIVTVISKSQERDGLFTYDLKKQALTKVNLPQESLFTLISALSPEKMIVATTDDSASTVSNLGEGYWPSLTQLYNFNPISNQAFKIPVKDTYIQYISTLPANYFNSVLGIKAYAQGGNPSDPNVTIIDLYSDKPTEENLQLKTFLLKPGLETKRQEQQSNPVPTLKPTTPPSSTRTPLPPRNPFPTRPPTINCKDLARAQCGQGWNHGKCVRKKSEQLKAQGKCNQSPLYLYGTEGQKVNVQVLTTVYNDNPLYDATAGYNITLLDSGNMLVNGNSYPALNYDYNSNLRKLTPPTRGTVAKRAEIEKVLRGYAKKLGLNEKETADLIKVGLTKTNSPYVFISFFDQEMSERILPLSFNPAPDNYLNVVFYFKQLDEEPNYTPAPPVFGSPLERSGLTAVEVSEIVE
jgi:hypothetical protein